MKKNIYNSRGNCCCRGNFKGKGMPNFYYFILTLFRFSVKFNRKFRFNLISFKGFGDRAVTHPRVLVHENSANGRAPHFVHLHGTQDTVTSLLLAKPAAEDQRNQPSQNNSLLGSKDSPQGPGGLILL